MNHLAEDAAVGGCNAFDGCIGTVDIPFFVHGDISVGIAVTGRDLTVLLQLFDPLCGSNETSLAVGSGIDIDAAGLRQCQPGTLVGCHLGVCHLGDMAADGIVGQSRGLLVLADDLSVRNKAQLDQGLESVADSKGKTVSVVQKVGDSLLDHGVAESGRKELGAAVRFVARGESARKHDDLGPGNGIRKGLGGIADILRAEIGKDAGNGPGTRCPEGRGSIIFAVCSGEDRNENSGLGNLVCADCHSSALVYGGFDRCRIFFGSGGEDLLERLLPGRDHIGDRNTLAVIGEDRVFSACHCSDDAPVKAFNISKGRQIIRRHLGQHIAHGIAEQILHAQFFDKCHAVAIAEGHLGGCGQNAVAVKGISRLNLSLPHEGSDHVVHMHDVVVYRNIELILLDAELDENIACSLEFGCHDVLRLSDIDREGDQCGRDIDVDPFLAEGAGHGILAADTGKTETDLGVIGAEQGGQGLAPPGGFLGHAPEILLESEVEVSVIAALCHDLGHGLSDRVNRAVVRTP